MPTSEPVCLPKVQSKSSSPALESIKVEKNHFDSLWPSLNENPQMNKPKLGKLSIKKSSSKEIKKKENSPVPVPSNETTLPVWGKKSNESSISQQHSLIDLMNEEMKKLELKTPPKVMESKPKKAINISSSSNNTTSPKGWNMSNQSSTSAACSSSPTVSIAQIIEMEKRSKDQYVKLKSRPLNLIQLEEAAIEDLKKIYNIDNITNMNIRIEIVDIDNINCPPVWKK